MSSKQSYSRLGSQYSTRPEEDYSQSDYLGLIDKTQGFHFIQRPSISFFFPRCYFRKNYWTLCTNWTKSSHTAKNRYSIWYGMTLNCHSFHSVYLYCFKISLKELEIKQLKQMIHSEDPKFSESTDTSWFINSLFISKLMYRYAHIYTSIAFVIIQIQHCTAKNNPNIFHWPSIFFLRGILLG